MRVPNVLSRMFRPNALFAVAVASLCAGCKVHHVLDTGHPAFQVDIGTFPSRQDQTSGDLLWIRKSLVDPNYECIAIRSGFIYSFDQYGPAGGILGIDRVADKDDPHFDPYHDRIDPSEFKDWIESQAPLVFTDLYDYHEINKEAAQASTPAGQFLTGIYAIYEPIGGQNDDRPVAWVWRPASPNDREFWLHYREDQLNGTRYQRPSTDLRSVTFQIVHVGNDDPSWVINGDSTQYAAAVAAYKQFAINYYAGMHFTVLAAELFPHDYQISESN